MRVAKILAVIVSIIISGILFVRLPAQYQIDIKSEQYFEKCTKQIRVDKSLCTRQPVPIQLTKNASLISAWWTITEISRSLPQKEVTAKWGPDISKLLLRNAIISIMPTLLALGFALIPQKRNK